MNRQVGSGSFHAFCTLHVKPKPGPTLVVGSRVYDGRIDRRALYENAVGVDLLGGPGVDIVADLEQPLAGQFSHIDCVSVLEHCRRPWLVAQTIETLLEPGGTLLVSVPFVWRIHAYPDDYWRMTPAALPVLFPAIHWHVLNIGNETLSKGPRIPGVAVDDHTYLSRTETYGFGGKP